MVSLSVCVCFKNPARSRRNSRYNFVAVKIIPYFGDFSYGLGGRVSILDKLVIYSQALSPYEKKRALKKVLLKE